MTTTVRVTAPGYAGKKSVVYTSQSGGPWTKHSVLTEGQSVELVACDGGQEVCVSRNSPTPNTPKRTRRADR